MEYKKLLIQSHPFAVASNCATTVSSEYLPKGIYYFKSGIKVYQYAGSMSRKKFSICVLLNNKTSGENISKTKVHLRIQKEVEPLIQVSGHFFIKKKSKISLDVLSEQHIYVYQIESFFKKEELHGA